MSARRTAILRDLEVVYALAQKTPRPRLADWSNKELRKERQRLGLAVYSHRGTRSK